MMGFNGFTLHETVQFQQQTVNVTNKIMELWNQP
jgi:hypothetical protein